MPDSAEEENEIPQQRHQADSERPVRRQPEGAMPSGAMEYSSGSPVFFEPQFICHSCGNKKGVGLLIGRCVKCGKLVCDECAEYKGRKLFCPDHAPMCAIATAAYGSRLAPEVEILRAFRDEVLSRSVMGRSFVDMYYVLSPPVARIVRGSAVLRKVCIRLLCPVVDMAKRLT